MKTIKTLFAGLFVAMTLSATHALAQDFPNKPIRIVVPYSPGGGTDAVARIMAQRLTATLGQSVLVENKPGASANIGSEFVARSPADGYTILVTAPNFTTSEALYDKLTWRFDDFIPLIHLVRYANVLVSAPDSKMVTLPEMVSSPKRPRRGWGAVLTREDLREVPMPRAERVEAAELDLKRCVLGRGLAHKPPSQPHAVVVRALHGVPGGHARDTASGQGCARRDGIEARDRSLCS
jgi:hypothetical protein